MSEHVNHPQHYQGENGIECIEVIRHYSCDIANALKYLMRAGKKHEMGMPNVEKEIEDLQKALWYIDDYKQHAAKMHAVEAKSELMQIYVERYTGHSIVDICKGYKGNIVLAMCQLLQIGLIMGGAVYTVYRWESILDDCKSCIQGRIEYIRGERKE